MRPRLQLRPLTCVSLLLLLTLALPNIVLGQPTAQGPWKLAPKTRERLAHAAKDSRLVPWQRDLMLRLARTGATATVGSSAAISGAGSPAIGAAADDGAWDGGVSGPREFHSANYDPVRDRMVVFGGVAGQFLDDVCVLSLSGTPAWTQLEPSGVPPSARYGHSAIYDPVRDRMVVYGGYDEAGNFLGDVHVLSLAGTPAWTQLAPSGVAPGVRAAHGAVYDPVRDRMVVFGGYSYDGADHYLDDVYALSLSGAPAWTQVTPSGEPPSGRYFHSVVYDPLRDRMVVFGGLSNDQVLGDVSALSLSGTPAWTTLTPVGVPPSARFAHSAIYDPVRDCMVVFGGVSVDSLHNDVHVLSLSGTPGWTQLTPSGESPGPRYAQSAIYDPVRDRMVVFGGRNDSESLGDTHFLSLAGTPTWTQLASPGAAPGGRFAHSTVYDPVRDRMVVFGGYYYDGAQHFFNDLYVLSLAGTPTWTQLTPSGAPPFVRAAHSAIYDPVRDRVVVFGGYSYDGSAHYLDDVYALSLAGAPAWTQLVPSGVPPTGRYGHSAIYDPVRDRMVVFGGLSSDYVLSDVFALSLSGTPAWTQLTPSGVPPEARFWHSAIYDPVRDRMVVFGGTNGGQFLNDVRVLSLADTPEWTLLDPSGVTPIGRNVHSAIYDPVRDRMVVFGGSYDDVSYEFLNDVQGLSLAGTPAWTQLAPTGVAPAARHGHSAIYDPVRDRMVVYGGENSSGTIDNSELGDARVLTWGTPALAAAACPGDVVWTRNATLPLTYHVTNPYGFSQTADYMLSSGRDWPIFPITGSVVLPPGVTELNLGAPVPDSAATGLNPLTFRATLRAVPQSALCSHNLHDVTTPALVSLVSAEADPGRVRLTWYSAGGSGSEATVYRRTEATDWRALGRVSADGTGQMVYEDRAVVPGERYGYRLAVVGQGLVEYAGETWVDVPQTVALALTGARPNPATADLAVTFSLADAAPARLEAFDLTGRRVATREVGALGGGSHVVRLGEGRPLAPGVYLLRLTQGSRSFKTRAVVVR